MNKKKKQKILINLSSYLKGRGSDKVVYRLYTTDSLFNEYNPMTYNNFVKYYQGTVKNPSFSAIYDLCNALDLSIERLINDENK